MSEPKSWDEEEAQFQAEKQLVAAPNEERVAFVERELGNLANATNLHADQIGRIMYGADGFAQRQDQLAAAIGELKAQYQGAVQAIQQLDAAIMALNGRLQDLEGARPAPMTESEVIEDTARRLSFDEDV